jgi:hypothetical protein
MNARMSVMYDFNGSNRESTWLFRSIPNARNSIIRCWYVAIQRSFRFSTLSASRYYGELGGLLSNPQLLP